MSDSTVRGGGVGFFGALFLVLLILKLLGVITWSWWWVTAPLWGPWVFMLVFVAIGGMAWAIFTAFESDENKKARKARKALDDLSRSLR